MVNSCILVSLYFWYLINETPITICYPLLSVAVSEGFIGEKVTLFYTKYMLNLGILLFI